MAYLIPPIPNQPVSDTHEWRDWFFNLGQTTNNGGIVRWDNIVFDGSNITSIQTRQHNSLQGLQGGGTSGTEYYHLSAADYNKVSNGFNYGAFHDINTQTAAVINTAYAVTFGKTDYSSNVSIGTPTSRVVTSIAGIYNFQFSAQLHKTNAAVGYVYIWPSVNGTAVTESASKIAINGSQAETIASWNFVLSMNANDYFELMWSVSDINCELLALTASAPVPAIPSVILTVTQVA